MSLNIPKAFDFTFARQQALQKFNAETQLQRLSEQKLLVEKAFSECDLRSHSIKLVIEGYQTQLELEIESDLNRQGYEIIYRVESPQSKCTQVIIQPKPTLLHSDSVFNLFEALLPMPLENQSTYVPIELNPSELFSDNFINDMLTQILTEVLSSPNTNTSSDSDDSYVDDLDSDVDVDDSDIDSDDCLDSESNESESELDEHINHLIYCRHCGKPHPPQ